MLSKKYSRRYALHMAAGMALGSHGSARSATYPDRPLRLVIGFPPGGPVDIAGRLVGEILSSALKQPVVVDNKPGAGGAIGLDAVAKAAPDGLTLGIGPVSCMAIMPARDTPATNAASTSAASKAAATSPASIDSS